jgi:hypothetical protein
VTGYQVNDFRRIAARLADLSVIIDRRRMLGVVRSENRARRGSPREASGRQAASRSTCHASALSGGA